MCVSPTHLHDKRKTQSLSSRRLYSYAEMPSIKDLNHGNSMILVLFGKSVVSHRLHDSPLRLNAACTLWRAGKGAKEVGRDLEIPKDKSIRPSIHVMQVERQMVHRPAEEIKRRFLGRPCFLTPLCCSFRPGEGRVVKNRGRQISHHMHCFFVASQFF